MIPILIAFLAGLMIGAAAGVLTISLTIAAKRADDEAFTAWLDRKVQADPVARQAAMDEEARLNWDATWEEHA